MAVAELPVGQWPDLIKCLVDSVVVPSSTEMQKVASLEAIGMYLFSESHSIFIVSFKNY